MMFGRVRTALVLVCIVLAAVAAASVKFVKLSCPVCAITATLEPLPRLDLVGVTFYGLLALALYRWKLNRYTLMALYFAAGCHLDLLYKLWRMRLACPPCIACACLVLLAAFVTYKLSARTAKVAALAGFMLMYGAFSVQLKLDGNRVENEAKRLIKPQTLDLSSTTGLPVYIFERHGCHSCQEFNATLLPAIRAIYDDRLLISIREAPEGCPVPTIVLGGTNPTVNVGVSHWSDFTHVVQAPLEQWESGHARQIAVQNSVH